MYNGCFPVDFTVLYMYNGCFPVDFMVLSMDGTSFPTVFGFHKTDRVQYTFKQAPDFFLRRKFCSSHGLRYICCGLKTIRMNKHFRILILTCRSGIVQTNVCGLRHPVTNHFKNYII
jgi:hypothetical protein